MLSLVVAIVVMLIGSALCSSSEAAILSVPVLKTQQLAESKKPAALALLAIVTDRGGWDLGGWVG
jgi:CBS domain containing-hemolysin-like protein